MTHALPFIRRSFIVEDPDLAADLRRDLGADTLFFICAIEAALEAQNDEVDAAPVDIARVRKMAREESEQLPAELVEEAA